MTEKWQQAVAMGFAGIELAGPASSVRDRSPEFLAARSRGAIFPTVSSGGAPFIGDLDPANRRQAIGNLKELLSAIAELNGIGATTPASFGVYSRALPPLKPPDGAAHRDVLIEAIAELGEHAESEGVVLLLEPLNRYEDYHLNRLDQAWEAVKASGSTGVGLLVDVFHMNIEEANIADAIRSCGSLVRHVHLADSNRLEPGAGHLDFAAIFAALREIGFNYFCALECSLTGEARAVLPRVVRHLEAIWESCLDVEGDPDNVD